MTLVDFRGFDTMGEITVLSLAAIGVFVMIKLGREHLYDRHGMQHDHEGATAFNDSGNDTVVIQTDTYFQDDDFPISPL